MDAKTYSPKAPVVRALQYTGHNSLRDIRDFALDHADGVMTETSYNSLYLTIMGHHNLILVLNDYLVYDGSKFTVQNAGAFEAKYEED